MLTIKQPDRNGSRLADEEAEIEDDKMAFMEYPLHDVEDNRNVFPTFQDDAELLNYKRTKLSHSDVLSMILVLALYVIVFATRSNLPEIFNFGPLFSAAVILEVTTFSMFSIIFFSMFLRHISRKDPLSLYYLFSRRFLSSKFKHRFDEIIPVAISITSGLFLYARVRAGQCDEQEDIWKTQSCNPVADCFSIPHDQVIITYMSPVICQLIFKGVRFHMILLCWAISTIFIVISIAYAQAGRQVWTVAYSPLFLFAVYESERMMRLSFLQNKVVVTHVTIRNESIDTARGHVRAMKKVCNNPDFLITHLLLSSDGLSFHR